MEIALQNTHVAVGHGSEGNGGGVVLALDEATKRNVLSQDSSLLVLSGDYDGGARGGRASVEENSTEENLRDCRRGLERHCLVGNPVTAGEGDTAARHGQLQIDQIDGARPGGDHRHGELHQVVDVLVYIVDVEVLERHLEQVKAVGASLVDELGRLRRPRRIVDCSDGDGNLHDRVQGAPGPKSARVANCHGENVANVAISAARIHKLLKRLLNDLQ
mmetsp:Transcript_15032/g.27976  ORF Transcript_15032/g.27976 Transcript_15032/m.27976 type:complete len:218 (-) Transcript_15032:5080-5733(-)